MAVDDLWYLKKRDENGDRQRSKRHGRGKRWRVRHVDPNTAEKVETLFEKQEDAKRFDANVRSDISQGKYIDPKVGTVKVKDYAEQWRKLQVHRASTAERVERMINRHVNPVIGELPMAGVRNSHIKRWVLDRSDVLEPSTLRTVFGSCLVPMFQSAVLDIIIPFSPCAGIKLPEIVSGDYYIATPQQVHALYRALPEEYRAVVHLAAGCGWRAGEIFGLEVDAIGFMKRKPEIDVRQQLVEIRGRVPYLSSPKTKTSRRTNELPAAAHEALARHIEVFQPKPIEIVDETDPRKPVTREATLMFPNKTRNGGLRRTVWSTIWRPATKRAGLPDGFGLRDLRHYFATLLIFGGANVKSVQLAMGHTTPTITLNVYTGYWPGAVDSASALVDAALGVSCAHVVPDDLENQR